MFLGEPIGKALTGKGLFRVATSVTHAKELLKSSGPEVLFEFSTDCLIISKYAEPLLLPAPRKKPGHAASRSIGE